MAQGNTTKQMGLKMTVEGQMEVQKGIEEINKAIDDTAKQAVKTKRSLGDMNGEFARMGAQASSVDDIIGGTFAALREGDGILGKVSGAMTVMSGGINTLTSGVRGFAGAFQGVIGLAGPWGMMIGGVVSGISSLVDMLHESEQRVQQQEKDVSALVAAYRSLGEAATYASAKAKVQEEQTANRILEERIQLEQQLEDMAGEYEKALQRRAEIERGIQAGEYEYVYMSHHVVDRLNEQIKLYESMQTQVMTYREEEKQRALEAARLQDEEIDRQHKLAYERERIAEREAAKKRAEAEAQKRQAAAQAAAQKAAAERIAQAKREEDMLASIYAQGEQQAWDLQEHTRVEQAQRQADARRAQIQQTIMDEQRLQQALVEYDRQTAITLATAHNQDIIDEIARQQKREQETRATFDRIAKAAADSAKAVVAAERKASEEAKMKRMKDQQAVITGYSALTEAATAWGSQSGIVQAMQMAASAIQAGCDSANYAADAAGAYASGNFIQAAGYTAASVAKAAAAAGYTKGIAQMSSSGYDVGTASTSSGGGATTSSSSPATPSSSSLTGRTAAQEEREIRIVIGFDHRSTSDSSISDAIVRGLNASADRRGSAKLSTRVLG